MKIKLSKVLWKEMGRKAGWIKEAQDVSKDSSTSTIKNFIANIKPIILKLKEGTAISSSEANSIIQFYLEVGATMPSMKNFVINIKDIIKKLTNGSNLSKNEMDTIVSFYLETINQA